MWVIVGLGNPGRKYERNRHNIGFRVVDELARRHGMSGYRQRFGGDTASGAVTAGGRPHKVVLLKPMEFMNVSGHAVQRAAHFYNVEPERVVVIHDELDIDFGRIKLKAGGGPGGHNGLRSIIQQLGSRDFLRVRVGIGKPGPPPSAGADGGAPRARARDSRVVRYVLSDFPASQEPEVAQLVDTAADATEVLVSEGLEAAMNRFHGAQNANRPDPGDPGGKDRV